MKKGDKVFELVQSMSMAEKRYFKIFANRHTIGEQNNYITLFDLIEGMDTADTRSLAVQLEEHGISAKHISSDKNYLYNLILRGLSSFYAGKTVSLKIKEQLHQVEILYDRGLYDHCLNILKKAKTQAQKYQLYPLLIDISTWAQKSLNQLGKTTKAAKSLNETMAYMADMDNTNAFLLLFYRMLDLEKKIPQARTPKEFEELEAFISHPFMQKESIPRSFQAKLYYWWIYAKYYFCINDKDNELVANEHVLSLMDVQDGFLEEFPEDYLEVYARVLNLKTGLKDEIFYPALKYFRSFPDRLKKSRRSLEGRVQILSYKIELYRLLTQRRYDEAAQLIPEVEKIFDRMQKRLSVEESMIMKYFFAYTNMARGAYKESLTHINSILNNFKYQDQPAYYACTELINLAVHYHLGNYSVLRYKTDAIKRTFSKEGILHEREVLLLKLFKTLAREETKGHEFSQKLFENFQQEVATQSQIQDKNHLCFDIDQWVESNIRQEFMGA